MSYSWTEELHLAPRIQMKGASDRWILKGEVNSNVPRNLDWEQKPQYVNYFNGLQIHIQNLIRGKQTTQKYFTSWLNCCC